MRHRKSRVLIYAASLMAAAALGGVITVMPKPPHMLSIQNPVIAWIALGFVGIGIGVVATSRNPFVCGIVSTLTMLVFAMAIVYM